jgi:hypothetical protein
MQRGSSERKRISVTAHQSVDQLVQPLALALAPKVARPPVLGPGEQLYVGATLRALSGPLTCPAIDCGAPATIQP